MYARSVAGRTLTFGVSGLLVRNSLVMYDHETGSLWSHLTGKALTGALAGEQLHVVAATQTTWAGWRRAHPESRILAVDPTLEGDPYGSYYRSSQIGVENDQDFVADPRLKPKDKVIGLRLDGRVKAYSLTTLAKDRVVNDLVGDVPVVVVFDWASESGAVYRRDPAGRVLSFKPMPSALGLTDAQTGSHWDGLTGRSADGPLEGTALEQVPITYAFWFAWWSVYPETDVFA